MEYRRLTREDRYQIEALLQRGLSLRSIARQLDRSPSTVSREIRRLKINRDTYRAEEAERKSQILRRQSHPELCRVDDEIKHYIQKKIRRSWSPRQVSIGIASELKRSLCHHTVYRWIDRDRNEGGDLWTRLRRIGKQTEKRKIYQCPRRLEGRRMIDERPKVVDKRNRLGDYERDLILGKAGGTALLTIVDRATRLVKIGWISKICSNQVHRETLRLLKNEIVHTITNDNGTEFSRHATTAKSLKAKIYFSHPYRSWERGTNENTNGRLRQYFPRREDIGKPTRRTLRRIAEELNERPRQCLGFKTGLQVYKTLRSKVLR